MYTGSLVSIRPTQFNDLPYIVRMEKMYSEFVGQYSIREHRQYIRKLNKAHYSIFDNKQNELVGYFLLNGLDNSIESIELQRIAIIKVGKGYGKETLAIIKQICFDKMETVSIWLDVFEDNKRAVQLYLSQGFSIQPELTEYISLNGRMRKLLIMKCFAYNLQQTM